MDSEQTAQRLIALLEELSREQGRIAVKITLDSHLERELGLDSLARAELLHRCEQAFGFSLNDDALLVETPRELLRRLLAASGAEPAPETDHERRPVTAATAAEPVLATTLLEALNWHVEIHPERTFLILYGKGDLPEEEISYGALLEQAQTVATGLRSQGLEPRQTVAIMLPTGRDYFLSFFGVLLAGGVPVPIYPPTRPSQVEEHLRRHVRILNNAESVLLITVPEAATVARLLKAQVLALRQVVTADELRRPAGAWTDPDIGALDLAFLQYTSGSTGDPKGVMLTHANLLANIRAMGGRIEASSADVFVSWLPLYHDMGLIGACLGGLYFGYPLAVMSPLSFMARPARWLWAIHRHGGTISAAPNFAYELCLRRLSDDSLKGLDLSSWRMACNGAEPVNPDTLESFVKRFGKYGFRAEAVAPVYGLAESSLAVTMHPRDRGLVVDRVQRERFMRTGEALPAAADDPNPLRSVCCGQALAGHEVRIVDAGGHELPERREGRLQFRGPSCTGGYYRNPEATKKLFQDDWLDSGDRAYAVGNDVYITGRVKELIIRSGRNFYPYELEQVVGDIDGVRKGNVAVFASPDPATGGERLVVVAESRETVPEKVEALRQRIQDAAVDLLGAPADDIVVAPPHTVLKTSSGKIRRATLRELYEQKSLGQSQRALWLQLARMGISSGLAQVRQWLRQAGSTLYAGYTWVVFALLTPFTWLGLMLLPRLTWRWALARQVGRLLLRLTGTSRQVTGLEHLPATGPYIVVVNHSSYLDSLILAGVLPGVFSYVAKRELASWAFMRWPLERLDTLLVERFDIQRSVAEAERKVEAVRAGKSLVIFPEGTFERMPGLLPFHMGAFLTAAQTGVPVVPVVIRGSRGMLRPRSWFPRRGRLRVSVFPAIAPEGNNWAAAVKLRDAVRAVILLHCGEPDANGGNGGNSPVTRM